MNFIGSHPLNLIGKVAIITSASSSLGAAICRSLLNSNALVLGLDTVPAHDTTSASGGSHFQFLQYDEKKGLGDGNEILEKLRSVFLKDEVAFWIDVVGELRIGGLKEVVEGMSERGEGLVLSVVGDAEREDEVIDEMRHTSAKLKNKGVRYNVLVPHNIDSGSTGSLLGVQTKVAMQDYIFMHDSRRKKGGYKVEIERELANLALFLCTKAGIGVEGAVIGTNGSCESFE